MLHVWAIFSSGYIKDHPYRQLLPAASTNYSFVLNDPKVGLFVILVAGKSD